jgi:hypothetical protein
MSEDQKPKKRTWIWVVVGIFFVLVVLVIGGVTFTAMWFRQNMTISEVTASTAEQEFAAARARFAGQEPLIELVDDRPRFKADRVAQNNTTPLKSMNVMAWDDREGKLVTFSLPFWILRMKSGPIRLSAYQAGWNDRGVSFTVEELEKAGPGLVMDVTEGRGGRVLIWVD